MASLDEIRERFSKEPTKPTKEPSPPNKKPYITHLPTDTNLPVMTFPFHGVSLSVKSIFPLVVERVAGELKPPQNSIRHECFEEIEVPNSVFTRHQEEAHEIIARGLGGSCERLLDLLASDVLKKYFQPTSPENIIKRGSSIILPPDGYMDIVEKCMEPHHLPLGETLLLVKQPYYYGCPIYHSNSVEAAYVINDRVYGFVDVSVSQDNDIFNNSVVVRLWATAHVWLPHPTPPIKRRFP